MEFSQFSNSAEKQAGNKYAEKMVLKNHTELIRDS